MTVEDSPFPVNAEREVIIERHRALYNKRLHQLAERDAALVANALCGMPKHYFPEAVCRMAYRHRWRAALELLQRMSVVPVMIDGNLHYNHTKESVAKLLDKLGCTTVTQFMVRFTNLVDIKPTDAHYLDRVGRHHNARRV